LLLGEAVIALGNPFGLGGSVTKGILSSKNRRLANQNEPLDVQDWL
jgi:S1-C subfamily serine protease